MSDTIRITILEDGTIKTETDRVSQANHSNAEGFLRDVARSAGGVLKVNQKVGAHTHDGTHYHEH